DAKYPINLITVHFSKNNETHTFGLREYTGNFPSITNYYYCPDEKQLLESFIDLFRKQKVDIITGWFCRFFDIPYLINRCAKLKIQSSLSPIGIYKENKSGGYHIERGGYIIAGVHILDGRDLYKNFVYEKKVSYSLGAIGLEEVGEGKLEFDGTINTLWRTDWNRYVEYNVQDVNLTRKIEAKKKHIELAINFCYQALIPFDSIFSSISLISGYIMKYLHERNMVFPDRDKKQHKNEKSPGAYVMAKEGHYHYVINFDVKSMYPHMIMQYNISPETLVLDPPEDEKKNLIKTPLSEYKTWETINNGDFYIGGIYYKKEKGILPDIVEKIFKERVLLDTKKDIADRKENGAKKEDLYTKYNKNIVDEVYESNFKSEYYDSQQKIRKILINSIFGVLGNPYFNFFDTNNFIAITLSSQNLIRYLSNCINKYIKENWHLIARKLYKLYPNIKEIKKIEKDVVILIDTDSNYLCLHEIIDSLGISFSNDKEFELFALNLIKKFFNPFFTRVLQKYADNYGVKQIIEFRYEKIIKQKIILAKKKYVDLVIHKKGKSYDSGKLDFTGIEVIRTDTPNFFRKSIIDVIEHIFKTNNKDEIIKLMKQIKTDFLKAYPDDIAIPTGVSDYQKWAYPIKTYIEQGLSYIKGIPIHNRAAINYNYLVKKFNLPYQTVDNGTKIKYVYVIPNKNILNQNVIGFIGKWPEEFNKMFTVDKEQQWQVAFQSVIERFFNVMGWGDKINLENNILDSIITFS
ncbi:MAG: DNA polymerase domain-containing protein, partial [Candidatus Woesearchaeota archaeon]